VVAEREARAGAGPRRVLYSVCDLAGHLPGLLLCKKLNPFFSSIFGTVGVLGFYFCSYFIFLVQSGEINTRGY
jgi:hypothetical protein